MGMEIFYPVKCYVAYEIYFPDLEKNNKISVSDLLFKVIQSLTKAIIFELFYYINGYFRV